MRRRERVALTLVAVAAVVGVVLLLTFTGSHSAGPLSRAFAALGARISGLETRAVQRVRGTGRADSLEWFAPYHRDLRKLRAPERILLGVYDAQMPASLTGAVVFERQLGVVFPLLHFYTAWGDKPDQQFPVRTVQAITELGSVPVITWEPWLTDFDSRLHPQLPLRDQRDKGGLAAIAVGDYDSYIDRWASAAADFGEPILLRFAHEMNDPYRYPWGPQNNSAADFIAAWRHVVQRFRLAGAGNVLFVWAPHVAYRDFNAFYPGNEWVDWAATGVLNFGTVARWSEWWTFHEIFGDKYDQLASHGKPIMIAEFGSLDVGGNRGEWLRSALTSLPDRYPRVRALLFFNVPRDMTVTYQALDWTFVNDSADVRAVREALATWPTVRQALAEWPAMR